LFPPYLGQNMNTGLDDAVNLGWKLAAVLHGWGGSVLLDSYSEERRPIGWRNSYASVETSQILARGQAFLAREGIPGGESPAAVRSRQRLGERLYDLCYQEWNTSGVVLDQRYTSSVIAKDDSVPPIYDGARYQPSAKPGHRAPHFQVGPGTPLLDRLGHGFTLLDLGAPEGATEGLTKAAADKGVPLELVAHRDPQLAALYGAPLVLVRTDQHVAWRGERPPADPKRLIDKVRGAA
jgi:FAD binding domain